MKLEDQLTSLELSRKLEKLGVKQESYFYWWKKQEEWVLAEYTRYGDGVMDEYVSAFTVAELGEMLPWRIDIPMSEYTGVVNSEGVSVKDYKLSQLRNFSDSETFVIAYCYERQNLEVLIECTAVTEADARAKCLVYLLENNLLKVEE